jgi:hypothetical protein
MGLMLGLKMKSEPRGFVAHLRDNHGLLTVAAGDNTCGIVPPLVIDDSHIDEFMDKLSAGAASYAAGDRRHDPAFPRILADAGGDAVAAMLNDALDRKAARAGGPRAKPDADAPLAGPCAGDDLREELDPHARVVRHGDAPAWVAAAIVLDAGTQLGRGETHCRYRARAQPHGRCDHDPHRRSRQDRGTGALCHAFR